jgi:hypothetical protein
MSLTIDLCEPVLCTLPHRIRELLSCSHTRTRRCGPILERRPGKNEENSPETGQHHRVRVSESGAIQSSGEGEEKTRRSAFFQSKTEAEAFLDWLDLTGSPCRKLEFDCEKGYTVYLLKTFRFRVKLGK